jgi:hypothetical protein
MNRHVKYSIAASGKVMVRLGNGKLREATPSEWIDIWSCDPRLTLLLAQAAH